MSLTNHKSNKKSMKQNDSVQILIIETCFYLASFYWAMQLFKLKDSHVVQTYSAFVFVTRTDCISNCNNNHPKVRPKPSEVSRLLQLTKLSFSMLQMGHGSHFGIKRQIQSFHSDIVIIMLINVQNVFRWTSLDFSNDSMLKNRD